MYPKHQSRAILLYSYPLKEADKGFILFTDKFGLIHAKAASLRSEKSKLKNKLSHYILMDLVLLRGKAGWKLIEINNLEKSVFDFNSGELRKIYSLFKVVLQNSAIEEVNPRLFDVLESILFIQVSIGNKSELQDIILAAVYDMLAALGYADLSLRFIEKRGFNRKLYNQNKSKVLQAINKAKSRSHISIDFI